MNHHLTLLNIYFGKDKYTVLVAMNLVVHHVTNVHLPEIWYLAQPLLAYAYYTT